jgi:hypothetical protein
MPANLIDKERIRPSQVAPQGPSAQNRQNFCVPTSPRSALKHADFPHGLQEFRTVRQSNEIKGAGRSKVRCETQHHPLHLVQADVVGPAIIE